METCEMEVDDAFPYFNRAEMKAQMEKLDTLDRSLQLAALRSMKNSVVGNAARKAEFSALGLCQKLISLIDKGFNQLGLSDKKAGDVYLNGDGGSDALYAVCTEAVIVVGSLVRSEDIAAQYVDAGGVSILCRGLFSMQDKAVTCCLRALRYLCENVRDERHLAVQEMVCQENVLLRLVDFLDNIEHAEFSALILSKAITKVESVEQLILMGAMVKLADLLQQPGVRLQCASLNALIRLLKCILDIYSGKFEVSCKFGVALVPSDTINALSALCQRLEQILPPLISCTSSTAIQLSACQLFSFMRTAKLISGPQTDATLRLKVFPTLVYLAKEGQPLPQACSALYTLAILMHDKPELQKAGIYCDQLSVSLVQRFLSSRKQDGGRENLDADVKHTFQTCCLNALAEMCSTVERLRKHAVNGELVTECVALCAKSPSIEIQLSAFNLLLALSRSVELLRSQLSDDEAWRPVLEVLQKAAPDLSVSQVWLLSIAVSVSANMLAEFYPGKTHLISGGALPRLVKIVRVFSEHTHGQCAQSPMIAIVSNALTALANAMTGKDGEKKLETMQLISEDLLLTCTAVEVQINVRSAAFHLLRNLFAHADTDGGSELGLQVAGHLQCTGFLSVLAENLVAADIAFTNDPTCRTCELPLAVLSAASNYFGCLASCSPVAQHSDFLQALQLFVSKYGFPLAQIAAVQCVHTIAKKGPRAEMDSAMQVVGIQHALKKIEVRSSHPSLLMIVKNTLELFS